MREYVQRKKMKGTVQIQKMGGTFISKFHETPSVWSDSPVPVLI